MWRYERPQAGRSREFYQVGVELFGADDPRADTEVINLILDIFQTLGFNENDIELRLNNRKLLEGLLLEEVLPNKITEVIRIIDKKSKLPKDVYLEELKKIGIRDPNKLDQLLEITLFERLENIDKNALATEGFNELKAIWPLLQKKFVTLSLSTARGLDYYSGTVFEVFDKSGKFRSLCGGGRYDDMVEAFGSKSCATGFSIGLSTLTLLLKDKKKLPELDLGVDYYVAPVKEFEKDAYDLVAQLRSKYSVETDLSGRNLGNQIKYANTIGAKNLIVFGEDEKKSGKVKVKNLATGKEEEKNIKEL
jgi:histidyl-tRNA synthetase